MALIDIGLAKRHLRVRTDADDDLIALYLMAAQAAAEAFLGARLCVTEEERAQLVVAGATPEGVLVAGADVKAAVLLTLGSLYEQREDLVFGQSVAKLPRGAESLLWPHRVDVGV
ncbi:head-tail connector protein [Achromobacter xylosoxidans]|uniref:head-tail connector protein n=1 Tax=Alcaligenes xylosoxydans xylosoxydans TaxID=85698 RepID=UPI001F13617A|nr:head-tail connector protein [Achromobacter xylosoxidans]